MKNKNTMEELKSLMKKGYVKHHTSKEKGYVSRKGDGYLRKYKGRFGDGYTHHTTNYHSNGFNFITYYVRPKAGDLLRVICTDDCGWTGSIKTIDNKTFEMESSDGNTGWYAANEVEFYGA